MCDSSWTRVVWFFPFQYNSTSTPYSPSACCSYQKDKWNNPGNLPKLALLRKSESTGYKIIYNWSSLGFTLYWSKCWVGSQDSKLVQHASYAVLPTEIVKIKSLDLKLKRMKLHFQAKDMQILDEHATMLSLRTLSLLFKVNLHLGRENKEKHNQ